MLMQSIKINNHVKRKKKDAAVERLQFQLYNILTCAELMMKLT